MNRLVFLVGINLLITSSWVASDFHEINKLPGTLAITEVPSGNNSLTTESEAGQNDVKRSKKSSLTTICVEIRPSSPHEEPYFMCKGADPYSPSHSSNGYPSAHSHYDKVDYKPYKAPHLTYKPKPNYKPEYSDDKYSPNPYHSESTYESPYHGPDSFEQYKPIQHHESNYDYKPKPAPTKYGNPSHDEYGKSPHSYSEYEKPSAAHKKYGSSHKPIYEDDGQQYESYEAPRPSYEKPKKYGAPVSYSSYDIPQKSYAKPSSAPYNLYESHSKPQYPSVNYEKENSYSKPKPSYEYAPTKPYSSSSGYNKYEKPSSYEHYESPQSYGQYESSGGYDDKKKGYAAPSYHKDPSYYGKQQSTPYKAPVYSAPPAYSPYKAELTYGLGAPAQAYKSMAAEPQKTSSPYGTFNNADDNEQGENESTLEVPRNEGPEKYALSSGMDDGTSPHLQSIHYAPTSDAHQDSHQLAPVTHAYQSPAPKVPCSTNYLLSCQPNVVPVPCYSPPVYSQPPVIYSQPSPVVYYPQVGAPLQPVQPQVSNVVNEKAQGFSPNARMEPTTTTVPMRQDSAAVDNKYDEKSSKDSNPAESISETENHERKNESQLEDNLENERHDHHSVIANQNSENSDKKSAVDTMIQMAKIVSKINKDSERREPSEELSQQDSSSKTIRSSSYSRNQ